MGLIKICAISDLHGQLDFNIEPAIIFYDNEGNQNIIPLDILFICGDVTLLQCHKDIQWGLSWFKKKFIPWCQKQPVEQIYMVAGNHDFALQDEKTIKELLRGTNITILYNEGAEYMDDDGKVWTIWGSPNCHIFGNWAFMYPDKYNKEMYERMPDNLDFLITHDAPYGRNDVLLQKDCRWANGEHIGNIPLVEVVKEKKPLYHFTGHLHSTDHELKNYDGTITACVSLLDENYQKSYKPLYLEVI